MSDNRHSEMAQYDTIRHRNEPRRWPHSKHTLVCRAAPAAPLGLSCHRAGTGIFREDILCYVRGTRPHNIETHRRKFTPQKHLQCGLPVCLRVALCEFPGSNVLINQTDVIMLHPDVSPLPPRIECGIALLDRVPPPPVPDKYLPLVEAALPNRIRLAQQPHQCPAGLPPQLPRSGGAITDMALACPPRGRGLREPRPCADRALARAFSFEEARDE